MAILDFCCFNSLFEDTFNSLLEDTLPVKEEVKEEIHIDLQCWGSGNAMSAATTFFFEDLSLHFH